MRLLAIGWLAVNLGAVCFVAYRDWRERRRLRTMDAALSRRVADYHRQNEGYKRALQDLYLAEVPVEVCDYGVWIGSQDPHIVAEVVASNPAFTKVRAA